jgi:glycosyltransferase involved in cell wall biosynthesis
MPQMVIVDTTLTQAVVGGAQSFLVDLCSGLVGRGWRVTVVTIPGPNAAVVKALRSRGAAVEDRAWRAWQLPEDRAGALASWMATAKPDLYLISISADVGWLALPLVPRQVVTVCVAHNDVEAFYAPLRHYEPFVDCAVGVSSEIHRRIVGDCGVPPSRARHIPYGVRSLAPADAAVRLSTERCGASIRIGYVGRLEQRQKRVLDLVGLLAALERKGVHFTCDVIGDGSDRELLAQGLGTLRLRNRPRFWGWLDSAAVRERLAELDVLVLFSSFEGLPVALLEAMGEGVVPVVTKIASGCPDVIRNGANGFLELVGDTAAFATRIDWLSRNGEQLIQMRRAAWQTARVYSIDRMVASYVSLLEPAGPQAIPRAPKPPGRYAIMPSCRSPHPRWLRTLKARLTAIRSQR